MYTLIREAKMKSLTVSIVGYEISDTASGNVTWYNHFETQFDTFLNI